MNVVWSKDAIDDYYQNIEYLQRRWPHDVVVEFIEDVETTIQLIQRFPGMYPLTNYRGVRKAVIHKNITLFFTLKENELMLVRFWNTLQNPDSLSL